MIHKKIGCKCPECGYEETRTVINGGQGVYINNLDGFYYTMCNKCRAKLYAKEIKKETANEDH